jgi:hypothetical protein
MSAFDPKRTLSVFSDALPGRKELGRKKEGRLTRRPSAKATQPGGMGSLTPPAIMSDS